MVKTALILTMALTITGCSLLGPAKIKTETQAVLVPVVHCPAPPEITRPVLPIETITPTEAQSDGEVAKHMKATIKTLIDYAELLESVIAEYGSINSMSEDIRKEIETKKLDVERTKDVP